MDRDDATTSEEIKSIQMIGTLPPWKGISAYCEALFDGIDRQCDRFKFTGWKSLYPKSLYPGGDPKTDEEPVEADNVERRLAWYDPSSWIRVGLDSDVEVVHAQWWSYPLALPYITIFAIGRARGKTVLLTVHNVKPHEQTSLTTFLNDAVYRFADEYVVHSEVNRTQLSEETSISAADIHVISHPTIGPEKRGISKADSLQELGLNAETNAVLFFGNIREYKGLDSLIQMVANVNEHDNVDLIVAGKCWVDWAEYEALIERHGLAEQVHRYPGYIPEEELEYFFTAADAVALPYDHFDAQSGVAELAEHFGTVSIGYDKGGLADQVDIVASDQDDFEQWLLTALTSGVETEQRQDDSVERHVELYEQLLDHR